jgi:hypothetical protein
LLRPHFSKKFSDHILNSCGFLGGGPRCHHETPHTEDLFRLGCDSQKPALGAQPSPSSLALFQSCHPSHLLIARSQPPPQQLQEFKLLSVEDSGEKCFHSVQSA